MKGKHKYSVLDETLTCATCPYAVVTPGFKDYRGEEILRHCPYRQFSFVYDTRAICHRHPGIDKIENDTPVKRKI